ncbi:hypothetical protein SPRG_05108 [Saprolegnia parasitica CBS 223.65]|uniref:PDZ domain-containing protein n=1 Tax=Saprolegnia parasitica (strain CBS 223.65) TaxID=695850 RepID=A0A067CUC7_SAPPC|nr:hypothetical protein SPRG_05108 [Saprolegnia parasitica CBS 223.65]KDO30397.1 hypothetical protein SPRG_05108 [Saprolegnia parasitica CBS 223.65]|eukprot:XP_012199007.1 hypothetical protein SPRG_05108 [Saprolegnia parasitica CBS 223.65]
MSRLAKIELKADIRVHRKQVRWLFHELLHAGEPVTVCFESPRLGLEVACRQPTVLRVTKINPAAHLPLRIGDYVTGVNDRDLAIEGADQNDFKAIVAAAPRPLVLHASRLGLPKAARQDATLSALKAILAQAKVLEIQGKELTMKSAPLYRACTDDEATMMKTTLSGQADLLAIIVREASTMRDGILASKETRLRLDLDKWISAKMAMHVDHVHRSLPMVTKLMKRVALTRLAEALDTSWVAAYSPVELKWLQSSENRIKALLTWLLDGLGQDHAHADAVDTAQRIVQQLVRHYTSIWMSNTQAAPGSVQKTLFDHARRLKTAVALPANTLLRQQLVTGQIAASAFLTMSADDLAPPQLREERQTYASQAMHNAILKTPTATKALIKTKNGFKEVATPHAIEVPVCESPAEVSDATSSPIARATLFPIPTKPVPVPLPSNTRTPNLVPSSRSVPRHVPPKPKPASSPVPTSRPKSIEEFRRSATDDTRPSKRPRVDAPAVITSINAPDPSRLEEMVLEDLAVLPTTLFFLRAVLENKAATDKQLAELVMRVENASQYQVAPNVLAKIASTTVHGEYRVDVAIGAYYLRITTAECLPQNRFPKEEAVRHLLALTTSLHGRWSSLLDTFAQRFGESEAKRLEHARVLAVEHVMESARQHFRLEEKRVNGRSLCLIRVNAALVAKGRGHDGPSAKKAACDMLGEFLVSVLVYHAPANRHYRYALQKGRRPSPT